MKTVRVHSWVCVAPSGEYESGSHSSEESVPDYLGDGIPPKIPMSMCRMVKLVADIPFPDDNEIQATIVSNESAEPAQPGE